MSEHDIVAEKDLEHLLHLLNGDVGDSCWNKQMERTTPNMVYQAWCHEPEVQWNIIESLAACLGLMPDCIWH